MAIHMDCFGLTDIGKERDANEDQFLIANLNKSLRVHQTSLQIDDETRFFGGSHGKLLLVADGVGGEAAGERASQLAVDSVTAYVLNTLRWYYLLDEGGESDFADELKNVLEDAQEALAREIEARPERQGMGTTLTMAFIVWPRIFVVHVGDSRCYLLRNSQLQQLTDDQTVAQGYVDAGLMSPEEAEDSRWSHILWNVVGGDSQKLEPAVYKAQLKVGDSLLLCTDGLTKHVSDDGILAALKPHAAAEEICHDLVSTANAAGGSDNITVVVANFREPEQFDRLAESTAAGEKMPKDADAPGETTPFHLDEKLQPAGPTAR